MTTKALTPPLDAEGYLIDPNDWTEAIAVELARREGITLGEDHWDAIRFMRRSYEENPGCRRRALRDPPPGRAPRAGRAQAPV